MWPRGRRSGDYGSFGYLTLCDRCPFSGLRCGFPPMEWLLQRLHSPIHLPLRPEPELSSAAVDSLLEVWELGRVVTTGEDKCREEEEGKESKHHGADNTSRLEPETSDNGDPA